MGGKKAPLGEIGKVTFTFAGDKVSFKDEDDTQEGTVKVDATKTPRAIDLIVPPDGPEKGKTLLCIYEVKDDELHLCVPDAGKNRPTEFSGKEGTGCTLM